MVCDPQVKHPCDSSRTEAFATSLIPRSSNDLCGCRMSATLSRNLWRSKGFATVAILCLGFGIGLNATIFSLSTASCSSRIPTPTLIAFWSSASRTENGR